MTGLVTLIFWLMLFGFYSRFKTVCKCNVYIFTVHCCENSGSLK